MPSTRSGRSSSVGPRQSASAGPRLWTRPRQSAGRRCPVTPDVIVIEDSSDEEPPPEASSSRKGKSKAAGVNASHKVTKGGSSTERSSAEVKVSFRFTQRRHSAHFPQWKLLALLEAEIECGSCTERMSVPYV